MSRRRLRRPVPPAGGVRVTGAFVDVIIAGGSGGLDAPRGLVFDGPLFSDGFESGDTAAWSAAVR